MSHLYEGSLTHVLHQCRFGDVASNKVADNWCYRDGHEGSHEPYNHTREYLVIIITISNQRNEMEVAEPRQHLDFCLELLGSLLRTQDYLVYVE